MMQQRNSVVPGAVLLCSLLWGAQAMAQQNPRLVTPGAAPAVAGQPAATAAARPAAASATSARPPASAIRQTVVPAAVATQPAAAPQPAQPMPVAVSPPAPPQPPVPPEPASIVLPVEIPTPSAGGQGVSAWWTPTPIGDETRALLAAQAQGAQAGNALPTLGATASASWRRYLKSFDHPLPEWFSEKVEVGM